MVERAPPGLNLVLGIDPGVKGAWALVSYDEILFGVGNLHGKRPGGIEFNRGLIETIRFWRASIVYAVLEEGSTRPQNSRWRVFRQGANVGAIEGILQAKDVPFLKVNPASWKAVLGLPPSREYKERKRVAKLLACATWPEKDFKRIDHAEAALIALWYVRMFANRGPDAVRGRC